MPDMNCINNYVYVFSFNYLLKFFLKMFVYIVIQLNEWIATFGKLQVLRMTVNNTIQLFDKHGLDIYYF